MRRITICALTVMTMLAGLATHRGLAGEMDAKAKALAALDEEWSKASESRDAARVASYYAEDALLYPPNEPAVSGRAAAQKLWEGFFAEPSLKISWKPVHAEVAGDIGYTAGTYELSLTGPDGKTITERGKTLCVWKKQKDGTWKAIHDMWNADTK